MKRKALSIKNIATELNISATTVSFVLNGKAKEMHISDTLAKKILDYVKWINYKPNQTAQSLRTGKSKILVFMVEDISNSFFSKLARILEDISYQNGYRLIFCSNENDDDKSKELIELFNFRQVDGFIIVPSPGIRDIITNLIDENIPVVLLDRYFDGLDCDSVVIDNEEASFDASIELINNGFKNIAFITMASSQTQMKDRLSGYKRAIANHNLNPMILEISYNDITNERGYEYIKDFINNHSDLDAVFFATNYLAQNGLQVFKNLNSNLLTELGIMVFDDNDMFKIYPTSISCVAQPVKEISFKVMELMLPLLNGKDIKIMPQRIVLKSKIILRESSCRK